MKLSKIFFTILPKVYCYGILLACILRPGGTVCLIISNILLNTVAFLVFIKAGIIMHESGHLLFARLAGGDPKRLVLGSGTEITRFHVGKTKIVLNTPLHGGFAYVSFESLNFLKLRYFLFMTGGITSNFLLAFMVYAHKGFHPGFMLGKTGIDLCSGFIAANVLLLLETLLPLQLKYSGTVVPTDGMNILKIPFQNKDDIKASLAGCDLIDAREYLENKEYDKAITCYHTFLKKDNSLVFPEINLSLAYLKKGEYEASIQLLESLEPKLASEENAVYHPIVCNDLAWLYLIKQNITKAKKFSRLAVELAPETKEYAATRGAVLIDSGETDAGAAILAEFANTSDAGSLSLLSCSYVAYTFYLRGNTTEMNTYLSFVDEHINELDLDEKTICERVRKKCCNTGEPNKK